MHNSIIGLVGWNVREDSTNPYCENTPKEGQG